jgi:hypothetical protein
MKVSGTGINDTVKGMRNSRMEILMLANSQRVGLQAKASINGQIETYMRVNF